MLGCLQFQPIDSEGEKSCLFHNTQPVWQYITAQTDSRVFYLKKQQPASIHSTHDDVGGKKSSIPNERTNEARQRGALANKRNKQAETTKTTTNREVTEISPYHHRDDVTASSGMYSSLSVCLSRPQLQLQPHKFYGPTSSCLLFKKAATAGFYSFDSMILHNDDWGFKALELNIIHVCIRTGTVLGEWVMGNFTGG